MTMSTEAVADLTPDQGTVSAAAPSDAVSPPAKPDRRRHAWRNDLAAAALRDSVTAPRYVEGTRRVVVRASAPFRREPKPSSAFETEALFGETVTVYDEANGWAWVQADRDRYVGYVPADALGAIAREPTHHVRAVATFVYPEPSIKVAPALYLSLNAQVTVIETEGLFSALATGGFVIAQHLARVDAFARDYVSVAERFEETPYLWGGRSRLGLDCSGLVQIAMQASGLACPRDSDMQAAEIGAALDVPDVLARPERADVDVDGLARGDLVFWPGHVGIMTDGHMLLHATGHFMSTVVEPVVDVALRTSRLTGDPVIAVRRPAALGSTE